MGAAGQAEIAPTLELQANLQQLFTQILYRCSVQYVVGKKFSSNHLHSGFVAGIFSCSSCSFQAPPTSVGNHRCACSRNERNSNDCSLRSACKFSDTAFGSRQEPIARFVETGQSVLIHQVAMQRLVGGNGKVLVADTGCRFSQEADSENQVPTSYYNAEIGRQSKHISVGNSFFVYSWSTCLAVYAWIGKFYWKRPNFA